MPVVLRLDRLLASRGYCSRSQAGDFLRSHAVVLESRRLARGEEKLPSDAPLLIDNEPIDPPTLLILLHKPLGFVCSRDDLGQLVYELLPERWSRRNPPISTVGRLDKDTSGLLLLTDDGPLLHRLTSPKQHVPRVYLATLQHPLRGDEPDLFASGTLQLDGDDKPLLPAHMEVVAPTLARLTLREGRYHQVRRMFAAVGNHVVALHRERIGNLALDDLAPGQHRLLDASARSLLDPAAPSPSDRVEPSPSDPAAPSPFDRAAPPQLDPKATPLLHPTPPR